MCAGQPSCRVIPRFQHHGQWNHHLSKSEFQYLGQYTCQRISVPWTVHLPEDFSNLGQYTCQRKADDFSTMQSTDPHQGFQGYGQCNNDWSKSEHQYIGQCSCLKKDNDFRTMQSTDITEDACDLKTMDSTVTTEKHQQFQLNGQCNYDWFQLPEEIYAFRTRDCTD